MPFSTNKAANSGTNGFHKRFWTTTTDATSKRRSAPQERGCREDQTTVAVICETYLNHSNIHDWPASYKIRRDYLWDFCTGLPPRTRNEGLTKKDTDRLRIHDGFGKTRLCDLPTYDITSWLDKHEDWTGARRNAVQAVRRAINYCLEQGLVTRSLIQGYKVRRSRGRVTYFTPEPLMQRG